MSELQTGALVDYIPQRILRRDSDTIIASNIARKKYTQALEKLWQKRNFTEFNLILQMHFNEIPYDKLDHFFTLAATITNTSILEHFLAREVAFSLNQKLETAAKFDNAPGIQLLVKYGASITPTAISNACAYGHIHIIKLFSKYDIDADIMLPIAVDHCYDDKLINIQHLDVHNKLLHEPVTYSDQFMILDYLLKECNADPTFMNFQAFTIAIKKNHRAAFNKLLLCPQIKPIQTWNLMALSVTLIPFDFFLKKVLESQFAQDVEIHERWFFAVELLTNMFTAPNFDLSKRQLIRNYTMSPDIAKHHSLKKSKKQEIHDFTLP